MNSFVKNYPTLNINKKEILRYSSCKEVTAEIELMMNDCINEVLPLLKPQICYSEIDQEAINKILSYSKENSIFRQYMLGCSKAILFVGTIGFGFDQLITRYQKTSMAKAQMLQAIGASAIEELCNEFYKEINSIYPNCKPRFSPGYGDLDLKSQQLIFNILGCQTKIGVSLNASYLMSPSKSVSAIIALKDED